MSPLVVWFAFSLTIIRTILTQWRRGGGEFRAAKQEDSRRRRATGFAVRHAMRGGEEREDEGGGGTSGNRLQLFARRPSEEISAELSSL